HACRKLSELPATFRSFDYATISDVVLTVRYTAREGPGLRQASEAALQARFADSGSPTDPGLIHLIDLCAASPSGWAQLLATGSGAFEVSATQLWNPSAKVVETDAVGIYAQ